MRQTLSIGERVGSNVRVAARNWAALPLRRAKIYRLHGTSWAAKLRFAKFQKGFAKLSGKASSRKESHAPEKTDGALISDNRHGVRGRFVVKKATHRFVLMRAS